jgi:hypothetical protein
MRERETNVTGVYGFQALEEGLFAAMTVCGEDKYPKVWTGSGATSPTERWLTKNTCRHGFMLNSTSTNALDNGWAGIGSWRFSFFCI